MKKLKWVNEKIVDGDKYEVFMEETITSSPPKEAKEKAKRIVLKNGKKLKVKGDFKTFWENLA